MAVLRPKRLMLAKLPFVVRRRRWAALIALAIIPPLLAVAAFAGYAAVTLVPADIANDWQSAAYANAAGTAVVAVIMLALPIVAVIAAILGIDRSFDFRVVIAPEGIWVTGVLMSRLLTWGEIRDIRFRRGRWVFWAGTFMVGHIAIYVDGSNNPRRHWSSLWFGYYDIPPLMDMRAKELTALLRHAKRRAATGWQDKPRVSIPTKTDHGRA